MIINVQLLAESAIIELNNEKNKSQLEQIGIMDYQNNILKKNLASDKNFQKTVDFIDQNLPEDNFPITYNFLIDALQQMHKFHDNYEIQILHILFNRLAYLNQDQQVLSIIIILYNII